MGALSRAVAVVWRFADSPITAWAERVQSNNVQDAIRIANRFGGGMNPAMVVGFFLIAGVVYRHHRWIAYAVARIPGDREMCCENYQSSRGNSGCGTCRLEGNDHGISTRHNNDTVKLEGPQNIVVSFRAEKKRIMKIRVVSEQCALDARGLPLVWLTGVNPAESVALLSGYVRGADLEDRHGDDLSHGALAAIALHADSAADGALDVDGVGHRRPEAPELGRDQQSRATCLAERRQGAAARRFEFAEGDFGQAFVQAGQIRLEAVACRLQKLHGKTPRVSGRAVRRLRRGRTQGRRRGAARGRRP